MKAWKMRSGARAVLTVLLAGVALIAFSGCVGSVSTFRNEHSWDSRFTAIVADLKPALERVSAAEDYRYPCLWGRCHRVLPTIVAWNSPAAGLWAGYGGYGEVIVVNLAYLGDMPRWLQRAALAHEIGHWVRWSPTHYWTDKGCSKRRLECEIGANIEAVHVLGLGWGIPHDEAVEQMHSMLVRLDVLSGGKPHKNGDHDQKVELEAFRQAFGCGDPSRRTCNREFPGLGG